jgi:hypothetical protein
MHEYCTVSPNQPTANLDGHERISVVVRALARGALGSRNGSRRSGQSQIAAADLQRHTE